MQQTQVSLSPIPTTTPLLAPTEQRAGLGPNLKVTEALGEPGGRRLTCDSDDTLSVTRETKEEGGSNSPDTWTYQGTVVSEAVPRVLVILTKVGSSGLAGAMEELSDAEWREFEKDCGKGMDTHGRRESERPYWSASSEMDKIMATICDDDKWDSAWRATIFGGAVSARLKARS